MEQNFTLIDNNTGVEKKARSVIKFVYGTNDYLIYTVDENENDVRIFTSRLITNNEGRTFIDNITAEEKNQLNSIVYNIIVMLPLDAKKGADEKSLIDNLTNKFSIKLSVAPRIIDKQQYYENSSIAITDRELVVLATEIVEKNNQLQQVNDFAIPTWTMPLTETYNNVSSETKTEVPATEPSINSVNNLPIAEEPTLTIQSPVSEINNIGTNNNVIPDIPVENQPPAPNQQSAILEAVVSDPSLNLQPNIQPNNVKAKKLSHRGFTNSKYIIIGTVCIVLAIAVVITAYILISNMK